MDETTRMTVDRPGVYRLTSDLTVRGSFSVATLPAGSEFRVTQVDGAGHKVIGPELGDWVHWDLPATPVPPRSPAPTAETRDPGVDAAWVEQAMGAIDGLSATGPAFTGHPIVDCVSSLRAALASEVERRERAERERDEALEQAKTAEREAGANWDMLKREAEEQHRLAKDMLHSVRIAAEEERLLAAKAVASAGHALALEQRRAEAAEASLSALRADLARTRAAITTLADEWERKERENREIYERELRFAKDPGSSATVTVLRAGDHAKLYRDHAAALRALSPSDTTGDTGANHE